MRRFNSVCFILLAFILVSASASAQLSATSSTAFSSTYAQQADFQTQYTSQNMNDYWPILSQKGEGGCQGRQDFILQVAPAGCQPMVVRSDLLAEQNVPVFCQVDALQINPLINVKEIKNIRFSGNYPSSVVGTGFHPSIASLRTRDTLLDSPLINNIGYVVVILKKNPNEASLPNSVTVDLSAQLEYDAGYSLGIGRTEFLLQTMSDEQWALNKAQYGFWNGKYFLRLESVDANNAEVSIYDGDAKVRSIRVGKGKTSNTVYLPGMYCQAGLQASYSGFQSGSARARIELVSDTGKDSFDVTGGSTFDSGRCTVGKIIPNATGFGSIELSCRGNSKVTLELKPLAGLTSNDLVDTALSDATMEKAFYDAITAYEEVAKQYPAERGADTEGAVVYGEQALLSALALTQKPATIEAKKGTQKRILEELIQMYPGSGNSSYYRSLLDSLVKVDRSKAIKVLKIDGSYRTIALSNIEAGTPSFATFRVGSSASFILNEFEYSGNETRLKAGSSSFNSATTKTAGKITTLRLERVIDPSSVEVSVWCDEKNSKNQIVPVSKGKKVLKSDEPATEFCTLEPVKLEEVKTTGVAKITLIPKVSGSNTQTNLTVKIGIEKRAIKLSPGRRQEIIETLNGTINKWQKISDRLGKTVTTLKTTCLATSAALIVKNLLLGLTGEAAAREQTMSGENGWIKKCENMIKGTSDTVTICLNKNEEKINKEIEARKEAMDKMDTITGEIEKKEGVTTNSGDIFGGSSVDSQKAAGFMLDKLQTDFKGDTRVDNLQKPDSRNRTAYTYVELRDLYYNMELSKAGYTDSAGKDADKTFSSIGAEQAQLNTIASNEKNTGLLIGSASDAVRETVVAPFYSISGGKANGITLNGLDGADNENLSAIISLKSGLYLFVGSRNADGRMNPIVVYNYSGAVAGSATLSDRNSDAGAVGRLLNNNNVIAIKDANVGAKYNTPINEYYRTVRYFDTEPYKGLPAYVPFDVSGGWYVKVEPKLGLANTPPAYSGGLPKSWKICNVMSDGVVSDGDDCEIINEGISSGYPVLGQSKTESDRLVQQSRSAILEAAAQSSLQKIKIGSQTFSKDSSAEPVLDAAQCQNFMSISDCRLLFNVCDPVICPASRCDLGGTYKVADVIQTGIVGSTLLCLPNIREPILMPVCLTGIQAGIDGWLSILKNYRDCLQESLDTGQMTGICDEMYSVYQCEFFWRQLAPLANILLPKMMSIVSGESQSRGGGEYMKTQAAWDNAQKSMNYFTQSYASNSFKAFNARSLTDIGTEVCRGSISANLPKDFKSVAEPESPPQFQAWFDSNKFSDVTVPPTSQYKVFYHIYAGKTAGVSYQVYLKNPPESSYYYSTPTVQVASGFIAAGQYASETKDFTAPEGYSNLCVRINNEDRCGFKQVSTSFAVNYLSDKYAESKISETNITTEQGCISGSPNLGALTANINPASAVEEATMPQDYKRGIIRICASVNPGASTDPGRYQEVGYCGDPKLRCWLDRQSIDRAITSENIGVKGETLSQLESAQKATLEGAGYLVSSEANAKLSELDKAVKDGLGNTLTSEAEVKKFIDKSINPLFEELVLNHHKARLLLIEADAIAKPFTLSAWLNVAPETPSTGAGGAGGTGATAGGTAAGGVGVGAGTAGGLSSPSPINIKVTTAPTYILHYNLDKSQNLVLHVNDSVGSITLYLGNSCTGYAVKRQLGSATARLNMTITLTPDDFEVIRGQQGYVALKDFNLTVCSGNTIATTKNVATIVFHIIEATNLAYSELFKVGDIVRGTSIVFTYEGNDQWESDQSTVISYIDSTSMLQFLDAARSGFDYTSGGIIRQFSDTGELINYLKRGTPPAFDISGTWMTILNVGVSTGAQFVQLNLSQKPGTGIVSGNYSYDSGEISGVMKGRNLSGTWHESGTKNGAFTFRFIDNTIFFGEWNLSGGSFNYNWSGIKTNEVFKVGDIAVDKNGNKFNIVSVTSDGDVIVDSLTSRMYGFPVRDISDLRGASALRVGDKWMSSRFEGYVEITDLLPSIKNNISVNVPAQGIGPEEIDVNTLLFRYS